MKYINAEKLIAVLERQNVDKKIIEPIICIIDYLRQDAEIDLEEEINKFLKSEESTTYENAGSYKVGVKDPKKIAYHFFELGLKARKEE